MTRPQPNEAASYYFKYIDLVPGDDVVAALRTQLDETVEFLKGISEEKSMGTYETGKWTIRELWNHVNDGERVFAFRALWFARGFQDALPSFEQDGAVEAAHADETPWNKLIDEFKSLRASTISFFESLPNEAWTRTGVASD
ncbi:MAG TPA: DinB family protein, partial [Pyrinomonadaceae bacterium]|nr:DinB family protein [Pyrinomonadaceae bacterium]